MFMWKWNIKLHFTSNSRKIGASHCEFDGKSMETETTTWSEFPSGEKAIVEQILASEERNISKRAGRRDSHSGLWVGKLTIWVWDGC